MQDRSANTEATHRQQADLLFGLIHVGPGLLRQFIDGVRRELNDVREMCRQALESGRYQDMIEPAFRVVHGIKGNAALFDLTQYHEFSRELENELQGPRQAAYPASEAWVGRLLDKVAVMESALDETDRLLSELIDIQQGAASIQTGTQSLLTNLRLLTDELSIGMGKRVRLVCVQFNLESLPEPVYHDVVEIITQLVRNAVAHGIESPARRRENGKPPTGTIRLQTGTSGGQWFVRIQDDGAGPDFDRLRELAPAHLKCSPAEAAALDRRALIELMLAPGVSTVPAPSDAAGRGVGTDVVLGHTRSLDGRLVLRYAVGGGCRFDVLLPQARLDKDR